MGTGELLAALRSTGEKKAGDIRREAEATADRLREEAADRLALLQEESRQEAERRVATQREALCAEGERKARQIRLAAQEQLARRLYDVARRLLPRLRGDGYPEIFRRLAAELPPAQWEKVRVNPADEGLAASLFPGARITTDVAVCGGLEALAGEGRLRVDNTLEKRLERGWPELLPLLIEETGSDA